MTGRPREASAVLGIVLPEEHGEARCRAQEARCGGEDIGVKTVEEEPRHGRGCLQVVTLAGRALLDGVTDALHTVTGAAFGDGGGEKVGQLEENGVKPQSVLVGAGESDEAGRELGDVAEKSAQELVVDVSHRLPHRLRWFIVALRGQNNT